MTRDIIKMCNSSGVPLVFALSRKKLGEAMGKVIRISVVGILDYSGAETLFNKMLTLAKAARKEWLQLNKDNKNNTKNSKQDEQHHNEGKENEQHHSDTKENEHAQQIEPHHSDTTENRHHYRDTQETEHDHKVILSNENTTLQIEVTPMEVKSETS
jgi:Fe2+ transport system protein B